MSGYNISENTGVPQVPYEPGRINNVFANFPAVNLPQINELQQQLPAAPDVAAAQPVNAPQVNDQPQRRFPNIIQDEQQENRDWLDILYSMSRLMVLLCLVYFYSSPMRCLIVILIGVALYL